MRYFVKISSNVDILHDVGKRITIESSLTYVGRDAFGLVEMKQNITKRSYALDPFDQSAFLV